MQIIERSLPKKQIVKKEPSVIVKEESEKTYKLWQSLATKSIPKHHRNFTALMKKRQVDAKRFSDSCQREVLCPFILLAFTVQCSCALVYSLNVCLKYPGKAQSKQVTETDEVCCNTYKEVG